MFRRVAIIAVLTVLLVSGAGFWWWNANPERRPEWLGNDLASCANCRNQVGLGLRVYANDHDGWFPKGRSNALQSLSLLMDEDPVYIRTLTSHRQAPALVREWSGHKKLPEDLMCLRYNEGLRQDDSPDLIVLYYYAPTRWECSIHKKPYLGRAVMEVDGSWDFVTEDEFVRLQRRTEEFISKRKTN